MPNPLVAIVGSADAARTDIEPPLVHPEIARKAAEAIGAELARRGCRIVIYSSDPTFIEGDVVRGFAGASTRDRQSTILVRFPFDVPAPQFPEMATHSRLFLSSRDTDDEWEASFFRSLQEVDAIIAIGGGRSTLIAGHVAIGRRMPILVLAAFGGAAQRLWRALRAGRDLLTEPEHDLMSRPDWQPTLAAQLVAALLAQHHRFADLREVTDPAERRRMRNVRVRAALGVGLAALALLTAALGFKSQGSPWLIYLVYLIGPAGGIAGAMLRSVFDHAAAAISVPVTIALGFAAGILTGLLYLLAQISAVGDGWHPAPSAPLFALAIGMVAGFTSEKVLRQMAGANVFSLPGFGALGDPARRPDRTVARTGDRNRTSPATS